jgi:hypothetical protein
VEQETYPPQSLSSRSSCTNFLNEPHRAHRQEKHLLNRESRGLSPKQMLGFVVRPGSKKRFFKHSRKSKRMIWLATSANVAFLYQSSSNSSVGTHLLEFQFCVKNANKAASLGLAANHHFIFLFLRRVRRATISTYINSQ